MDTPNPMRRKISLFLRTIILLALLAFPALLYTERMIHSFSSILIFSSKPYNSRNITAKYVDSSDLNYEADDRFEFDPDQCSLADGKWVFTRSIKPLYSDRTCPYSERQFSCVENGRLDSDYRHWEWEPDNCMLPRFDPKKALGNLKGKRLMFVGDSLQREQWLSFVCLVQSVIPEAMKSMKGDLLHSAFRAKEYNATIEFYWAPFLVESNSDYPILTNPKKIIVKVDSVAKHAKHWIGMDILVFNTFVWWMNRPKIKSLWGSFANGEEGYEELDTPISYKIGLKTWGNWVDSNVNPNKTQVFFTTMSPTHLMSTDWGNTHGTKCFNETKPITEKRYWGSGSDKMMMSIVANVVRRMKVHVTLINITQLSEYRVDAHTSIYAELGGKLLTSEEKADPLHYADCIHWCLPGVPDAWNQIFYAHLL